MGTITIRPATADDWAGIARLLSAAFHQAHEEDSEFFDRNVFEPARNLVAIDSDDDTLVGNAGAYTRDMSVPGAVVPAAHVTLVGVAPTHRRRGILRTFMTRQLDELAAAGREPIAALWASEGRIYQRFGYGLACTKLDLNADNRSLRLFAPPSSPGTPAGRLRALDGDDPSTAAATLATVFDQLRPDRPGWSSRDEHWWRRVLSDPASRRHGATELNVLVHEGQSGVDGYALWRVKPEWGPGGPAGEVRVREIMATTPAAYHAIWQFLFSVDLSRSVAHWSIATDEPLLYLADEPRALQTKLSDGLWVRVVNVAGALSARRYSAPIELVIDVTDALLPNNGGRWRLTVGPSGVGTVARTEGPADLSCDIAVLGAVYLGGTRFGALAGAGRVTEHRPGALAAADVAFGWHRAPSAIEIF